MVLRVCRPSEWSGFEENNSTYFRKKTESTFFKNEKKERSCLVLMLLGYCRKLLKMYTQMFFQCKDISTKAFSSSSKWCKWCVAAWGAGPWEGFKGRCDCCILNLCAAELLSPARAAGRTQSHCSLARVTVPVAPGGSSAALHTSSIHGRSPPWQGMARGHCLAETQVEFQCLKCTPFSYC